MVGGLLAAADVHFATFKDFWAEVVLETTKLEEDKSKPKQKRSSLLVSLGYLAHLIIIKDDVRKEKGVIMVNFLVFGLRRSKSDLQGCQRILDEKKQRLV